MVSQHPHRHPVAVRVELDGTGSASFDWIQVVDALSRGLAGVLRSTLGNDVTVVGLRFIDADGRASDGPAPNGLTLLGFKTTP